jgi:dTDP-glucose 4,6-dehydratase
MKVLITGGAGFIGSNFVRYFLAEHPEDSVVVLDKLTYAGRIESLQDLMTYERMEFLQGDISDPVAVRGALEGCDAIVNFAAESHVDRSIEAPGHFIQTDVYGTYVLLEEGRRAGVERYLQISTDEVYGSIEDGSFTEQSPLVPSSPYSASKAGGDLVVGAYHHTFGIDAVVSRASNNYGPYQYPEKLIPLCVLNALHGDPLPVYGDGMQVRNWLHVDDHCRGIDAVLRKGKAGETYNIGGPDELPNIEVVRKILALTGRDESLIEHVTDRLGHDRRYSLSSGKIADLGWEAEIGFEEGLASTVSWYRDNAWWWEPIRSDEYREYYERQYGQKLRGNIGAHVGAHLKSSESAKPPPE